MGTLLTQEQAEAKSLAVGIKMVGKYINAKTNTEFECPYCGKKFLTTLPRIYSGNTKSCGCLNLANLHKPKSESHRQKISTTVWRGTK